MKYLMAYVAIGAILAFPANAACIKLDTAVYKRAIAIPAKRLVELGAIAARIGDDGVANPSEYLSSQGEDGCDRIVSADWTSHGYYIINAYTRILRNAVLFAQNCSAYQINDQKLTKFTQYFKITEISDGFPQGMDGVPVPASIRDTTGAVSKSILRLRNVKDDKSCAAEFQARMRYAYYLERK